MSLKPPKHPKLTPMRALDFVKSLSRARGTGEASTMAYEINEVVEALEHHVKAALAQRRRKP